MATTVMKVEAEGETCCVCGRAGELLAPEEHDAAAPPLQVPLRTMLLHLNNNKVVPEGRLCTNCIQRAMEAYEFSSALSTQAVPPLSEKIRALRRRLHELTQKIDVFIVVGGPGAGAGNAYSEDDIIMVEKDALAAAAAADDEDLEHARNAKGDNVYQCSVCPLSFQRVSEYRSHAATHPAHAQHSCWTCGGQFPSRRELRLHAAAHAAPLALICHLCNTTFQSQSEQRKHSCAARCPACGAASGSRAALARHVTSQHGRTAPPPHACPACFLTLPSGELLSAHLLLHRQDKQFVCGYADCVLRFATRSHLMAHIRKCHAAELPPEEEPAATPAAANTCDHCGRTFASPAAVKRHARVHRAAGDLTRPAGDVTQLDSDANIHYELQEEVLEQSQYSMEEGEVEGEVEYLEVEALEDGEGEGLEGIQYEFKQEVM